MRRYLVIMAECAIVAALIGGPFFYWLLFVME
jgi:nitrogen fixation-related uncharacterized protein